MEKRLKVIARMRSDFPQKFCALCSFVSADKFMYPALAKKQEQAFVIACICVHYLYKNHIFYALI